MKKILLFLFLLVVSISLTVGSLDDEIKEEGEEFVYFGSTALNHAQEFNADIDYNFVYKQLLDYVFKIQVNNEKLAYEATLHDTVFNQFKHRRYEGNYDFSTGIRQVYDQLKKYLEMAKSFSLYYEYAEKWIQKRLEYLPMGSQPVLNEILNSLMTIKLSINSMKNINTAILNTQEVINKIKGLMNIEPQVLENQTNIDSDFLDFNSEEFNDLWSMFFPEPTDTEIPSEGLTADNRNKNEVIDKNVVLDVDKNKESNPVNPEEELDDPFDLISFEPVGDVPFHDTLPINIDDDFVNHDNTDHHYNYSNENNVFVSNDINEQTMDDLIDELIAEAENDLKEMRELKQIPAENEVLVENMKPVENELPENPMEKSVTDMGASSSKSFNKSTPKKDKRKLNEIKEVDEYKNDKKRSIIG